MKSGIITVKDLDTAMVELKKVTDETEETYNKFTETAFKLGKELSRTGIEVVQATSDFARMGYDIKQAAELAYEALLMTNVGDGIDNIDEATSSIIATLKGFRIEGEETATAARHINDAFNEVANNFAVDTGSLAEGIKRTSAVLNQAGNSFEESIGMLTGAYEVIQNMPKASSGINIIAQRLKAMDEEGNKIEGLAPKLEKAFGDIGLSLYNTNGELKSTYENLGALAEVFPKLTKEQQNYISELVSGKRQSVVLMSIMSNWESIEEAVISATNSTGSAMAENEKYLNSIEGKVANFTSTVQMFWNTAVNSDAIKNIVDFGTSLMEHLTDLTNKFGIFGNTLGIIIPLIGIKYVLAVTKATKATIQQKLTSDLLGNSTISLLNGFKLLIGQLFGIKTAADGAKISFLGLNAAAGIISITLAAIPMIIGAIATAEDKRKRALEESIEAFKRQQEISTNTNDLISSYEELANKTKLTTEEQEKLFNIKEKIKELLPESKTYLDNENLSLKEQVEIVKELNEKELERLEIEAHKQISRGSRTYEDEKKELENLIALLGEWKEKQKELSQKFFDKTISQDELSIYKEISEKMPELQEKINKLTDSTESYESAVDFLTNGIQNNTDAVDENTDATDKNNDSAGDLETTLSTLKDTTDEAMDSYELLNGALIELQTEGYLSKKTLDKLIETYPELATQTDLSKDAIIRWITTEKNATKDKIQAEIDRTQATIMQTLNRIDAYASEAEALEELYGLQRAIDRGMSTGDVELDARLNQKYVDLSGAFDKIKGIKAQLNYLKGVQTWFTNEDKKAQDKINKKNKSGSKSKKDEYKAEADRYAKLNLELDKNNVLLQKNKTLQELSSNDLEKKLKLMDEEIELNKKRQKSLNDLNNERRKEMKELENSLSKQGFKFSGTGDNRTITNLNNVKGKTKEVEEQFKRYIELQSKELPQASQEWWKILKDIEQINLNKITTQFDIQDKKLKSLTDSFADLEYQSQLLADDDYTGKADNTAQKIGNLKAQVEQAKKELEELNKKGFKEGSKEAELYTQRQEELTQRIEEGTLAINQQGQSLIDLRESARQAWITEQNKLYQDQQDRLSALDAIQEKIVQIIRKRGEEEKKALDKAHKTEIDSLEERHKERKKKYQEDLDEYKKMIQGKIDALDEQWEEEDYLEDLNEEREKANEIQKEIDVLSLDNSLTARNKVIELREELAKINENIAKKQQKRERDLLKKSLQDELKQHEKDAKDKEDIADELYENEKKRIEEEYNINKEFLERKYSDEQVYAEARESIMRGQVAVAEGVFRDIYDAFSDFEDKFGKGMGILGDIIRDDFTRELDKARDAIEALEYESRNILPQYDSDYQPRDDEWDYRDPPEYDYREDTHESRPQLKTIKEYSEIYKQAREDLDWQTMEWANRQANILRGLGDIITATVDIEFIKKKAKSRGYKTGGETSKTGLHWLDGEDGKPERILSAQQTKDFNKLVDMQSGLLKVFGNNNFEDIIKKAVSPMANINISKIPNVTPRQDTILQIDKLINVEGDMTKDVLPEVKIMGNNAIDKLVKNLNKNGIRPVRV